MKNTLRPYKADTPEHTVQRIKDIISRHEIPVIEQALGDGDMFCSCRIYISHDDDSSIGTNGKGMNRQYAMASGYAEFMERFQNRVIVYPNPANIGAECRFYPDEQPYSFNHDEAIEQVRRFVPRVLPPEGLKAEKLEGMALPFYHVNTGKVEAVPCSLIRWVNGSNGMAAGNIREEALVQGFCEIFERYCIQEMYRRKIVPPDMPRTEFEGTDVLRRLDVLRDRYGMDYSIKDYSLGEGFPVLGLLLYNRDRTKYILHLGADLNPLVALERCFTEIFQGYTAETLKFENDVNECERLDVFNEFKRSLMYGRGRQDESFFSGRQSYEHTGYTTIPLGKDFREDLHNICHWLIAKGYDIYIRDNSFMGFPALHIVVPGLSEMAHTFCNLNRRVSHMQLTENHINPLFRLRHLDHDECLAVIDYLKQLDKDAVDLFTRNSNPNNTVNRNLLLMLLYIKVGMKDEAISCIEAYRAHCEGKGRTIRTYYLAILVMLRGWSVDGYDFRDRYIAKLILDDPESALCYIDTPDCFNCDRCRLAEGCRYPLLREIETISQKAMKANVIDQSSLAELF